MSMLSSLGRSRDSKPWNEARTRQVPVDSHTGSRRDFLRRYELAARQAAKNPRSQREPFLATLLDLVADTRMLKIAFEQLQHQGGQSPGPNGLRYEDLNHFGIWDTINALSQAIKDGTYRPGPTRKIKIPKSSGGTRTLELANIEDRIVAKAVLNVTQPYLDPTFEDCSFGCRPGRDRFGALAEARYQAETQNHRIWITEDVKNAFDSIPSPRLMDLLKKHLPEDLCILIERLVRRTVDEEVKRRGIQQGNPLSPLLLNLYLDHHLDKVWKRKFPDIPLLRTVDDILVTTDTEEDVPRVQEELQNLLRSAGMPLQETKSHVAHLENGESTVWLGYHLSWEQDALKVQIPDCGWERLEVAFQEAYQKSSPSRYVETCVMGWLEQLAPAFREHERVLPHIYELASRYGHEELPEEEVLMDIWRQGYEKWERRYREHLECRDLCVS